MEGVIFRSPSRASPPNAVESYRRVNRYRYGQMALLAMVFLFSASTLLELTSVIIPIKDNFADCCVYTTRFNLELKENNSRQFSFKVDTCNRSSHCSLMQFVWSLSSAVAFIMIWFFGFFHPKVSAFAKRNESTSARLVLPSILIFIFCSIMVLATTVIISIGNASFCRLNRIELWKSFESTCFGAPKINLTDDENPIQADFVLLRNGEITAWLSTLFWILNVALLFYRFFYHIDFPDYFFEKKSFRKRIGRKGRADDETSFSVSNSRTIEDDRKSEDEDNSIFQRPSSESSDLSNRKKKRRVNFEDFYVDSPPTSSSQSKPSELIQFENKNGVQNEDEEEEEGDQFETADSDTPTEDETKNDGQYINI